MNNDFQSLCMRADKASGTLLENLAHIETALDGLQNEVAKLPFFVKSFVSSEVKKGTGQDIPAWSDTIGGLTDLIRSARDAVQRSSVSGAAADADRSAIISASERMTAEQPKLEGLASFMEKVPSRLNSLPSGLVPADRRAELLATIDQQVRAARRVIAAMPELVQSLDGLAGRG